MGLVDAEGAHEARDGTGHAVAGIGVQVVGAEARLPELAGGIAFKHRPLPGAEHGNAGGAGLLERGLPLGRHDVEGLVPTDGGELAVLVVDPVLLAQQRGGEAVLPVHDLGQEVALDAVETAVDRRLGSPWVATTLSFCTPTTTEQPVPRSGRRLVPAHAGVSGGRRCVDRNRQASGSRRCGSGLGLQVAAAIAVAITGGQRCVHGRHPEKRVKTVELGRPWRAAPRSSSRRGRRRAGPQWRRWRRGGQRTCRACSAHAASRSPRYGAGGVRP